MPINNFNPGLTIVTCVSNWTMYKNEFLRTLLPSIHSKERKIPFQLIAIDNTKNQRSAAAVLNEGIDRAKYTYVICIHQDIRFSENWLNVVFEQLRYLPPRWGVVGSVGFDRHGKGIGALQNPDGTWFGSSCKAGKVENLDEVCLIVDKRNKLRFDDKTFTGFHFYGADICLQAIQKQLMNYAIDAPFIHLSYGSYDEAFHVYAKIFLKKWESVNHIKTTTLWKYHKFISFGYENQLFFSNTYFFHNWLDRWKNELAGFITVCLYLAYFGFWMYLIIFITFMVALSYYLAIHFSNPKLNRMINSIRASIIILFLLSSLILIHWHIFVISIIFLAINRIVEKLVFTKP